MSTTAPKTTIENSSLDSFEIGRRFEEFIKNLFNQSHFEVVEYNESKKHKDPWMAGHLSNPDLRMMFGTSRKYEFAVECKYRTRFIDDRLTWAKLRNIESYKEFARETRMPVFVAIGVGGKPENPEELFVTPLQSIIHSTEVNKSELLVFNRNPHRRFFYDYIQKELF
jgi:hypothetical protein